MINRPNHDRSLIEPLEPRAYLAAFRPPAVPLVVNNPYLSVWSEANNLTDDITREWTGNPQPLISLIKIDGQTSRLMGAAATNPMASIPAFPQTGLQVTPTRSIYDFDNGHVHVTMTFMTPALPSNLDVLTRPITYINWAVSSVDGQSHNVSIYESSSSLLSVTSNTHVVQWSRTTSGPITALRVGTTSQTLFQPAGDQVGIDWGYLYAAAQTGQALASAAGNPELIGQFEGAGLLGLDDHRAPRQAQYDEPVLAFSFALGSVTPGTPVQRHMEIGYDEIYAVNYFGQKLLPYWKRNGITMPQLLQQADADYDSLAAQCASFDSSLTSDLTAEGGAQYAQLAALAYRQSLGATGIAADSNKQPLLFTKEQSSNGDIATVDVIYPGDPMLLLLSPTLAKASIVPILSYAASSHWTFPNAPHDLGTYPNALGRDDGGEAMPVEESANMLILVDAIAKIENSTEFANQWWPQLTQWANFLKPYAVDPGNQLTTDDFLGTINHSANLAVKAIEALGAYAQLAQMRGDTTTANSFTSTAQSDVTHWISVTNAGDHYDMVYNQSNTWSLKYNLVWDKILGLNLFPTSVASTEIAYYKRAMKTYGVAVEGTTNTAKTDWELWAATLATNTSDFQTLIAPIYNYMNTTGSRQPMQDSYDITDVNSGGFHARSVVGGVFIKMLSDFSMWQKYASQDHTVLTGWAGLPTATPVMPNAQTSPQTWRYTTQPPPANWTAQPFDDSTWSTGPGGFGVAGTPGTIVGTTWNTSDIWLRKSFTMPAGTFSNLEIQAYHDEDMEVYINGILATSASGYDTQYDFFDIAPGALAQLTPGATVEFAVHCHQTVGGQDIDVGLVNISAPASVNPLSARVIHTSGDISPQPWMQLPPAPSTQLFSPHFSERLDSLDDLMRVPSMLQAG
jgi:hypothetical protein